MPPPPPAAQFKTPLPSVCKKYPAVPPKILMLLMSPNVNRFPFQEVFGTPPRLPALLNCNVPFAPPGLPPPSKGCPFAYL